MFSTTVEYALRAVVWLADHHDRTPAGCSVIAKQIQVPEAYLAKVMQALAKVEIVVSTRGARGGFQLNHSPDSLTVWEVVNAVDPKCRIERCPLKLKSHRERMCPMHSSLNAAMEEVEKALSNSTIASLLNDSTRPKPMVESAL